MESVLLQNVALFTSLVSGSIRSSQMTDYNGSGWVDYVGFGISTSDVHEISGVEKNQSWYMYNLSREKKNVRSFNRA